jgi:hypothetical protein
MVDAVTPLERLAVPLFGLRDERGQAQPERQDDRVHHHVPMTRGN